MGTKSSGRKKVGIKHASVVLGFAKRLREVRRAHGMSQAELAEKAGIHWTYEGRLERGLASPGLDLVDKLATALNVPIADLLLPVQPADPTPQMQDQARRSLESIIQRADQSALGVLNALLKMISEGVNRGY